MDYLKKIAVRFDQTGQLIDSKGLSVTNSGSFFRLMPDEVAVLCITFHTVTQTEGLPTVAALPLDPALSIAAVAGTAAKATASPLLYVAMSATAPDADGINDPGDWTGGGTADPAAGQLSIRVNTGNVNFLAATAGTAYLAIEAIPAGSTLKTVLAACPFTVAGRAMLEGDPPEPAAGETYLTSVEILALLRSAPVREFSVDGVTAWHATQAAADRFYRDSYQGGTPSIATALIVGPQGVTGPEPSGVVKIVNGNAPDSTGAVTLAIPTAGTDVAPLGADGKIPSQYLNATASTHVVATIAARDALTPTLVGDRAYVIDASADTTVTAGAAEYIWSGTAWCKIAEAESLDLILSWDNLMGKPATFPPSSHTHTPSEAGAAPAVHNHDSAYAAKSSEHTHANAASLAKLGEGIDGKPTYNGTAIGGSGGVADLSGAVQRYEATVDASGVVTITGGTAVSALRIGDEIVTSGGAFKKVRASVTVGSPADGSRVTVSGITTPAAANGVYLLTSANTWKHATADYWIYIWQTSYWALAASQSITNPGESLFYATSSAAASPWLVTSWTTGPTGTGAPALADTGTEMTVSNTIALFAPAALPDDATRQGNAVNAAGGLVRIGSDDALPAKYRPAHELPAASDNTPFLAWDLISRGNDASCKFLLQPINATGAIADTAHGATTPATITNSGGVTVNASGDLVFSGSNYLEIPANALPSDVLTADHEWMFEIEFTPEAIGSTQYVFGYADLPRLDLILMSSGSLSAGGLYDNWGVASASKMLVTYEYYQDGSDWKLAFFIGGDVKNARTGQLSTYRTQALRIGSAVGSGNRGLTGTVSMVRFCNAAPHRGQSFTPIARPYLPPITSWAPKTVAQVKTLLGLETPWYVVSGVSTGEIVNPANGARQKFTLSDSVTLTAPVLSADVPELLLQITVAANQTVAIGSTQLIATAGVYQIGWMWDGAATRRYPVVEVS